MISFVGAGPGAADLITMRGAQKLAAADVVIWASSLVPEALLDHCHEGVEAHDSKTMTLEDVTAVYAAHPDAAIVRLHSGDPSVYGAIGEQIDWCVENDREYEIVPGVTSVAAAAAALRKELTVPERGVHPPGRPNECVDASERRCCCVCSARHVTGNFSVGRSTEGTTRRAARHHFWLYSRYARCHS
jgi:precorrin-2 methylase